MGLSSRLSLGSQLAITGSTILACAILTASAPLYAQPAATPAPTPTPKIALVMPATPLLPAKFGDWQQAAPSSSNAFQPQGELAAALKEDGLTRASQQSYTRASASVELTAYQFIDTTGAFAAYTFLRKPTDQPVSGVKLGTSAVKQGETILVWDGPTVVSAVFHGPAQPADLQPLIPVLPKVGGPKGLPPLLPTFLPTRNLQSETLKYALGPQSYAAMSGVLPPDIVGFDKSAEAVTAKYAGKGTLTLLLYPTPQIAGDHGRQIEAEMNREGAAAGTVKLRREGPLLILTTGAWRPAEAQKLIEATHLHDELTWNKPMPLDFHTEVKKTASLLTDILVLTGVLFLAAVILALFFGGGRALIRILQGKPAATEPEFLSIDLREGPGEEGHFKPLH
jgi:hypothetical protein